MSHFNLKSLSFYAIAISSVLVLFKIVSAYGETKLKAASNLGGSYQILEKENFPDCLQAKKITLNIEQSGIYLFGNLEIQSLSNQNQTLRGLQAGEFNSADSHSQIPLNGKLAREEILLSGKGSLHTCNSDLQLTIQGHKEKNNLIGKIEESSTATDGIFTAHQLESKSESSEKH
jgi:hypothetical protein